MKRRIFILSGLLIGPSLAAAAQAPEQIGTIRIEVQSDAEGVSGATVVVNGIAHTTDARGLLVLNVPAGASDVTATKEGFTPVTTVVQVTAGQEQRLQIELGEPLEEEVTVVASTRTEARIEDLPIRVEVVPQEEIDEKLVMTPGDVSMMLTETNGLRVQVTSPSLGSANVRVQGLRGRYTQILADGLPLYGQAGSIGILQIPPMDLGQVEVIKGVASALYGASALGGVINLVSRRPQVGRREREVLVNRTSRSGTDSVVWLAERGERWGYTFVGGGHLQERTDVNRDGWTDIPGYQRVVARPRLFWEDGAGQSVFMTIGAMAENRKGGTVADALAPDGAAFPESVNTRRFDGGFVARFVTSRRRVVAVRASGLGQWHVLRFGEAGEHDLHHTWFAESSITGIDARHTWVLGGAFQRELYRSRDLPVFDYTYAIPSVFAQDDYAPASWLTVSASGRLDVHNEAGTFFSPRVSALLKPKSEWTLRLSTGTGFFAPTPFTEETEATGLSRLAPLGRLEPERGRSVSLDLGWKRAPLEVTATLFRSAIEDALLLRETGRAVKPVEIVNSSRPSRTIGSELIARFRRGEIDLLATHMFVWGTEDDPDTGTRREVPFNPRHTAGIDLLWDFEARGRLGVELFYTGRQQLDDSPFRERSEPYLLWGFLAQWRLGRSIAYLNCENLSNVRQARYDPLVRPRRAPDGFWTVDAWAPLDGRMINAGLRLRF